MLHRDIKPANILLDAQGVARLGDFGLVTDELVLGYGSQAGYFDHIAYEVWQGSGTSVKSDLWALGMTLYRLIHGKSWYEESRSPREVVRDGGFAKSLQWLPHVPKAWRREIRKMLCDNPTDRHQNAHQVLKGIADLEVEPEWTVEVSADEIKWQQRKTKRQVNVIWERISKRKHKWRAWSEPLGPGRSKSLAGSDGEVGKREALSGLQKFFQN
jgi:serine/threonine-protein kinase